MANRALIPKSRNENDYIFDEYLHIMYKDVGLRRGLVSIGFSLIRGLLIPKNFELHLLLYL